MGRHALVDRGTALDRMVERFWLHGYDATSIDDLLGATGMHRGSFYRAFGDKHGAFLAALDRYVERAATEQVGPAISGRGSPRRRLLRLLHLRLDVALGTAGAGAPGGGHIPPGCLVANSALEVAAHDPATRAIVAAALEAMRVAVARLITEAIDAGEVDPTVDVPAAADQLFTILQGVNVLARTTGDRTHLRRVLTNAVTTALPAPTGA
jgi:TetR/AcrR family transcriptional repressor of nem operon